jgi:AraC family transcriptional regulator, regulatory protein of adaptative response / DNA-3-methyladenine glycosylase II
MAIRGRRRAHEQPSPPNIMGLDERALDRARVSRDPRFDGRFFIAVTSTGIYCRPICPAPSPKKANVRYYATAAAAAEAGFRPCLRCRPEAAPGTPAWMGTSTVVRRALRLIDDGGLDDGSVETLASRVGIGARQLHRLFVQHVGASPITVAQTRRLFFAKRLLDETPLPITQIALAAGYGSVRRFNDAFSRTYSRAPRDLRRQRRVGPAVQQENEVVLRLSYRPPYDWRAMSEELAARAVPGVERVDVRGYARTLAVDGGHAIICVHPVDNADALELRARGVAPAALFQLSRTARRVFDLASDPAPVELVLKRDTLLAPLVKRCPGLRIPGAWSGFEYAVRAVLAEHVSLATVQMAMKRLVLHQGTRIAGGSDGLTHLFPSPANLASARLDGLGLGAAPSAALRALARAVVVGAVDFEAPEQVAAMMAALPGVGARAAEDVILHALGEPDAFPVGDKVLRRMASSDGATLTESELDERAEGWRPWRGYAAVHLWRAAHRVRKWSVAAKRSA